MYLLINSVANLSGLVRDSEFLAEHWTLTITTKVNKQKELMKCYTYTPTGSYFGGLRSLVIICYTLGLFVCLN